MNRVQQLISTATSIAESVHYAIAWNEPLNGDEIEVFVETLTKELKQLNGED